MDRGGKTDGRTSHFQGKFVGKSTFGPQRDDSHRFTMDSIRASVVFIPSSQYLPRCRLFLWKNSLNFSGSFEFTISARSPADDVHTESTSGTYGFCWRISAYRAGSCESNRPTSDSSIW